jgi:hypothetical protein
MKLILRAVLMTLLSVWVGAVFSQDVAITGSTMPGKGPRELVLIRRQGASPVLVVEIRASTTDTEAHELHQKVLIALREGYEERSFPLKRSDDKRINQVIRCLVVVSGGFVASSVEVRCGRHFPRRIFVGLSDSGINTSEFDTVAGRISGMIDEMYGLALKLPGE